MVAMAPEPEKSFAPMHRMDRVDSTQDAAWRADREGAPHGSVFWAEEQAEGRGRHGHRWLSPRGQNVYLSVLLRPPPPAAGWLTLTLAAGVAAAEAVADSTGALPDIRWPNDLLLGGKKAAGILAETSISGAPPAAPRAAVLGIGINANQTVFPPELAGLATSLRLFLGHAVDREALVATLLGRLRQRYDQWAEGGIGALLAAFEQMSSYARGRRVRVGGGTGEGGGFNGTTAGLDPSGFLRVFPDRAPGSVQLILTGEVRPLET